MSAKRGSLKILLLGVTLVPFVVSYGRPHSSSRAQDDCRVTIAGSEEPEVLPAHAVWESVFQRVQESSPSGHALQLPPGVDSRLQMVAPPTLERVRVLRQSLVIAPTAGALQNRDREMVTAEAVLDARDEAVRDLSTLQFRELHSQVATLAQDLVVTLPLAGRKVEATQPFCEVKVSGVDSPHLIPEHKVWEVFFDLWSRGANGNRLANGTFDRAYLIVASRTLKLGSEDATGVLDQVSLAEDAIKELRRAAHGNRGRDYEMELQRVVAEQRHFLQRRMSRNGWHAVISYVDGTRGGFTWWYRSRLNG